MQTAVLPYSIFYYKSGKTGNHHQRMKKAGGLRRMKKITLFLAVAAISAASVFPSFAGSNAAVVPAVYGTFQTTAANTQTTGTLTVQVPAGYTQGDSSDGTITFIN